MHRCLEIQELLEHIVQFVRDTGTLYNLTICCRHFSSAARRVLWTTRGDLLPWLRLLPPDLCRHHEALRPGLQVEFLREPKTSDFAAAMPYTPYISKIKLVFRGKRSKYQEIGHDLLYQLDRFIPLSSLFPNLRSFTWFDPGYGARLVISPTIQNLSLYTPLAQAKNAFISLPKVCPALETIRWHSLSEETPESERAGPVLTVILPKFPNLRIVSFRSIYLDHACLRHLAALSNLHTLKWGWEESQETFSNAHPGNPYFPELRHYKQWRMKSLQTFITIANLMTSSKLETLEAFSSNGNAEQLHTIFTLLSGKVNHLALKQVVINVESDSGSSPVTINTLAPLLPFRNVEVLKIRDPGDGRAHPLGFDFDNESLRSLASSFPLLKRLEFGCEGVPQTWKKPNKITLPGLIDLVKGCPKLEGVLLRFDFTVDCDLHLLDTSDLGSCPKLETLGVGDSPISDGEAIGFVLARLFPNHPRLHFLPEMEGQEQWEKVEEAFREGL